MQKGQSFFKFLLKLIAAIFVGVTSFFASLFLIFVVLSIVVAGFALSFDNEFDSSLNSLKTVYGKSESKNKLLALSINGIILGEKDETQTPFDLLASNVVYGYEVKKQLLDAAKDQAIKGVILQINSPGGTIYGSHAIADGVAEYKKQTNKPVIAYVGGLAASGGYWAAVSADKVYADFGSTIGSIGVLFGPIKFYNKVISEDGGILLGGVVTQNGIDTTYFTAGKSKDIGNPYRQITPEEAAILQRSVNNEYENFVRFVSQSRSIDSSQIKNQIGALIYDNKTARELKLIDETKNKEDSYKTLTVFSSLKDDDYQVVTVRKEPAFAKALLQSFSKQSGTRSTLCSTLTSSILAYHGDVGAFCQ